MHTLVCVSSLHLFCIVSVGVGRKQIWDSMACRYTRYRLCHESTSGREKVELKLSHLSSRGFACWKSIVNLLEAKWWWEMTTLPWRGTRNMSMLSTAYRLLFLGATSQQLWLLEKQAGRVATTWHENRCKCKMAILAKKQPSECSSLAAEGSKQLSALEPPEACVQCHSLLLRKNWGSIESPVTNKNTNMGPDVAEDSFPF